LYIQRVAYNAEDHSEADTITFEEALPKIECCNEQEKLDLSQGFWDYYQQAKQIKEPGYQPLSPQSIETKAINNLKTLIRMDYEILKPYRGFIRMLLDDILDYGTLPDFTLRRIANLETVNSSKLKKLQRDVKALQSELGINYLNSEKIEQSQLKPQIIIAIENQKI
jgi:hypothetical protein